MSKLPPSLKKKLQQRSNQCQALTLNDERCKNKGYINLNVFHKIPKLNILVKVVAGRYGVRFSRDCCNTCKKHGKIILTAVINELREKLLKKYINTVFEMFLGVVFEEEDIKAMDFISEHT